jgi:hypothetical protein
MWRRDFRAAYAKPRRAEHRGAIVGTSRTQCGIMQANNAQYCPQLNAIFDEVFRRATSKGRGK